MRIFHLALASDWEAARRSGRYTISTRGRTLAEEGFIHASRGDQWQGVRERFYSDVVEDLLLLVIETDLLDVPVVEESVPGTTETFPHVYGALRPRAVVQVLPLTATVPASGPGRWLRSERQRASRNPGPAPESFSRVYLRELFHHLALASLVMTAVVTGALLGLASTHAWGPLLGSVAGAAVGVVAARALHRRRERQLDAGSGSPG